MKEIVVSFEWQYLVEFPIAELHSATGIGRAMLYRRDEKIL